MSFKYNFLQFLDIFRTDGSKAFHLGPGANSQGFGQAVIQFFTNTVGEKWPGEITAYNGGVTGDVLDFHSPGMNVDPTILRAYIDMYGVASGVGARTTLILAGDNLELTSSDDVNGAQIICQGVLRGNNATDPPNINAQGTAFSPSIANLVVRGAPYNLTVSKIGTDLAMINGQLQNNTGAALANGVNAFVNKLPAWAIPTHTQTISLTGLNLATPAGQVSHCEIVSTNGIQLWGQAIPNAAFFAIHGVYSLV